MSLTWRNVWFEARAWLESALGLSKGQAHLHLGLGPFPVCIMLFLPRRNGMLPAWNMTVGLQGHDALLAHRDSVKLALDRTKEIECAT